MAVLLPCEGSHCVQGQRTHSSLINESFKGSCSSATLQEWTIQQLHWILIQVKITHLIPFYQSVTNCSLAVIWISAAGCVCSSTTHIWHDPC